MLQQYAEGVGSSGSIEGVICNSFRLGHIYGLRGTRLEELSMADSTRGRSSARKIDTLTAP